MNVFVTVGTTRFDSLIKYLDENSDLLNMKIEFQTAGGKYLPVNHPSFSFVDIATIDKKYHEADVVITHAGAGTIFKLLEMKKKMIVVPNTERSDKHQTDIADYISRNNYAFVAYDFNQIPDMLSRIGDQQFAEYHEDKFFKAEEIIEFILNKGRSNRVSKHLPPP